MSGLGAARQPDEKHSSVDHQTLGANALDIAVIVVYRSDPWRVATVLYRQDQVVRTHERWNELPVCGYGSDELDAAWKYFLDRVIEGSGGNGITYELAGFEIGNVDGIEGTVEGEFAITSVFRTEHLPAPHTGLVQTLTVENRFQSRNDDDDLITNSFGGDVTWNAHVPWLYRSLASPISTDEMPEAPRRSEDHMVAAAYWTPLLHLLLYSFGWSHPAHGLRWWYDTGKPTDDRRFELIAQVWDRGGQLDWFFAWLQSSEWFGTAPTRDANEMQWIRRQHEIAESSGIANPLVGGSDPLHLSLHCDGPTQPSSGASSLLYSSRTERRASLILDSMMGWYTTLANSAADLPRLGTRSWHVDVIVKPVGWLGTYRQSRITDRWFSGPHRLHVIGNTATRPFEAR